MPLTHPYTALERRYPRKAQYWPNNRRARDSTTMYDKKKPPNPQRSPAHAEGMETVQRLLPAS
jgi:hypothetical protein